MAEITILGPDCPSEEEILFSRPEALNRQIRELLANGTALDLRSPLGDMLRDCMTPGEVDAAANMPVPDDCGFDGVTCDACRGLFRFINCQHCHGAFDQKIHQRADEPPAPVRAPASARGFFERMRSAWDILKRR